MPVKRYRFKVDTPWGKKGQDVELTLSGLVVGHNNWTYLPEAYPHLFEEIPRENPGEKVANWLASFYGYEPINGNAQGDVNRLAAQKLIAAGLDPEKLEIKP